MTTDSDSDEDRDITTDAGFDPEQVSDEPAALPPPTAAPIHGYPLFDHRPKSAHGKRLLSSKWHLLMQTGDGKPKELAGAELEAAIIVTCGRMIGRSVTEDEQRARSLMMNGRRYYWNTETNKGK